MDFFQNIRFELNYEWSSDEDEGKLNPAVPTSWFAKDHQPNWTNCRRPRTRGTLWGRQYGLSTAKVLRSFYGSVQTTKGELYKISLQIWLSKLTEPEPWRYYGTASLPLLWYWLNKKQVLSRGMRPKQVCTWPPLEADNSVNKQSIYF